MRRLRGGDWGANWRALPGPTMVAVGTWCAAGDLTVEALDASVRLAVPASFWWLIVAFALAWLLPAWRTRPVLALPALIPVVPWLPVPLTPVVLLWTGWLAWIPIGMTVLAALRTGAPNPRLDDTASHIPRSMATAGLVTLVALLLTTWAIAPRVPAGDEPHYLMITKSLLVDGDLRIENNHVRGDLAPLLPAEIRPHYLRRGIDGEIYSIHAPGVGILVLPAFAVFGYPGAQLAIVALAAITGALVWLLGWLATAHRGAAWFGWASIVGSITFLVQGVTIFPDGPGALAVAVGALSTAAVVSGQAGRWIILVASVSLAILPWLHSRFVVLAAGLGVVLVAALVTDRSLPPSKRWVRIAGFLLVPAVSSVAWFGYFRAIYGVANPSAPYGPNPEVNPAYVPGGLIGLLFDQQFGLIASAPVLLAALIGLSLRPPALPRRTLVGPAVVALLYLSASATYWMWWAGVPAPPARFAAAILPVLAAPAAVLWSRSGAHGRTALLGLLALTVGISIALLGVDRGAMVWNTRDGVSQLLEWIGAAADLTRGWPSFFWALVPGDVRSVVPFVQHVAWWLLVAGFSVWLMKVTQRRLPHIAALTAACLIPVSLTLAVQGSWWLTSSSGLAPHRSQLKALSALREGQSVWRIAPVSTKRVQDDGRIVVRAWDGHRLGTLGVAALTNVPPGQYELRVVARRTARGSVTVRVDGTPWPSRTLEPRTEQDVPLDLPQGAVSVTIEPDAAARAAITSIDLHPLTDDRPREFPR